MPLEDQTKNLQAREQWVQFWLVSHKADYLLQHSKMVHTKAKNNDSTFSHSETTKSLSREHLILLPLISSKSIALVFQLFFYASLFWSVSSYLFLSCFLRLQSYMFSIATQADWGSYLFLLHLKGGRCDNHRVVSRHLSMSAGSDRENWFLPKGYSERLDNSGQFAQEGRSSESYPPGDLIF